MMKLLLVLLACVAAANALSYSYQYYCARQFHVFPSSACYRYTVYCPSTWCSTSYYAPILKVYPGDDCGTSGFKEKTPEEVVAEMRNLLNSALSKMTSQMYAKRDAWIRHLDSVHAEYKSYYKKYLSMFYTYRYNCGLYTGINYIKERDAKIREYFAQLDKIRNETYAKYNKSISERIAALKKYHTDILNQGHECLTTRVNKISEFRKSIIKKSHDGVVKFAKLHLAILKKRKDNYYNSLRQVFSVCSDWWTALKGAVSVIYYQQKERKKVENFVRIYALKLATHHKKLLQFYTCAYKCYMSNGCIQFSRKSYYQQCKEIGTSCVYKTNYGILKYCISPFSFKYRTCVYKDLKTCDVNQDETNATKVIGDMKNKRDALLKEYDSKFNSWKSTWVSYHLRYKAEFERIVRERHSWYCGYLYKSYISCNGYVTIYQTNYLAKLKSDLKKQAEEVCRKYYSNLLAKIIECVQKHSQSKASFKKSFDDLISKLQTKYNECAAKKKTAIVDYETKLKAQRDTQRAKLVEAANKARDAHLAAFDKMIAYYQGSDCDSLTKWMIGCYRYNISRKTSSIISQFDSYWRSMLPKLVHHFTCNYRCVISACVAPKYYFGSYYSWKYCLPTVNSYSYQLSCWRMYH